MSKLERAMAAKRMLLLIQTVRMEALGWVSKIGTRDRRSKRIAKVIQYLDQIDADAFDAIQELNEWSQL